MENNVSFDTGLLFDPTIDHEAVYESFVPFVKDIFARQTNVYIDENWGMAYGSQGCVLDTKFHPPIKELRSYLNSVLPKMITSSNPDCDGRASDENCFSIRIGGAQTQSKQCGNSNIQVDYGSSDHDFQVFWRMLLKQKCQCGKDLDDHIPLAFWFLEFGPDGLGQWEKTGYSFKNVLPVVIDHLTYLNDEAVIDWKSCSHSDGAFSKIATSKGVMLSRDGKGGLDHQYKDSNGVPRDCRHHTKLNDKDSGRSAFYGGRIYFAIEGRSTVLIGKVSPHE